VNARLAAMRPMSALSTRRTTAATNEMNARIELSIPPLERVKPRTRRGTSWAMRSSPRPGDALGTSPLMVSSTRQSMRQGIIPPRDDRAQREAPCKLKGDLRDQQTRAGVESRYAACTIKDRTINMASTQTAVLGGGCFWCLEAVFNRLKGVQSVESGYAGGSMPNPSYEAVCSGDTGHAE